MWVLHLLLVQWCSVFGVEAILCWEAGGGGWFLCGLPCHSDSCVVGVSPLDHFFFVGVILGFGNCTDERCPR